MAKEHSSDSSAPINRNGTFSLDQCREAALAEIDEAKFSRFHVKVCLVAGIGFFADAYDLFVINLASTMFGYLPESYHELSRSNLRDFCLKAAAPVGTLFGQIIFGWLADRAGRKKMYGIELMIMIVGTFGQALAGATQTVSIIGTLIVWRFIMGVGIGGDYPLTAVIVSEFSPVKIRGRLMTAVFACQGWGNFAAALASLVLVICFQAQLKGQSLAGSPQPGSGSPSIDHIWRVLIGLGCIPAVVGLYFRLTVPETPRFTIDINRNLDQAQADLGALNGAGHYEAELIRRLIVPKAGWKDFVHYFSKWNNLKVLIGASYSWFAIDFAFYGLGLNTNSFIQNIVFSTSPRTLYDKLYDASANSLLIAAAGLIPGYWVAFLLIDRWGRKPIQLLGFTALSILFIVTGVTFNRFTTTNNGQKVTVFLYCLGNFFQNFGPNTTTFIIPGELFPTRYRSTCHGIAGAVGKLGAIVSLLVFYGIQVHGSSQPANLNQTLGHIFLIIGFVMMTGIGSTLWLPETSGRTLEELSNEKQQGFVRGYAHLQSSIQLLSLRNSTP